MALEFKKSDVDELHFDEKVLLMTNTLNWFAIRSEKIYTQLKAVKEKIKEASDQQLSQEVKQIHYDTVQEWEKIRKEMLLKLTDIIELFGNFIDGSDVLDEYDTLVTTPVYDIIYERFEPENDIS